MKTGEAWFVTKVFKWAQDQISELRRRSELEVQVPSEREPWTRKLLEREVDRKFNTDLPPSPKNNRARLLEWLAYWPFSMVATVCGDLLQKIVMWVYHSLGGILSRISNAIARRYNMDWNIK